MTSPWLAAIADRANLALAFHRAARGKAGRSEVQRFRANLDSELAALARHLLAGSVVPAPRHTFVIRDPKERRITAPSFAERVLHHAILNVCGPRFESWLLPESFACRPGRGRLAALERAGMWQATRGYYLQMDVRKFFDSVPHEHLLARLGERFRDPGLRDLFERIVRSYDSGLASRDGRVRGLPIGALTSQHFANFYLGYLDRFVMQRLRVRAYVRYMDDFVVWHDSSARLAAVRRRIRGYLRRELDLEVKRVAPIQRAADGLPFLGFVLGVDQVRPNRRSARRYDKKLARLEARFDAGLLSERELQDRAQALVAFLREGDRVQMFMGSLQDAPIA